MALYELLIDKEESILRRCREAVDEAAGSEVGWDIDETLPGLYRELVEVLRLSEETDALHARQRFVWDTVTAKSSRTHAEMLFRLGCNISQLVHGYGAICQSITEYAHEEKVQLTSMEFGQLNFCLDVAIAQAVTAFLALAQKELSRKNALRIGETIHELRNALTGAVLAHELISTGRVGAGGATSGALTLSHQLMTLIIDRAVAEVRLGGAQQPEVNSLNLYSILSNVKVAATPAAKAKLIRLNLDIETTLHVAADPHLLTSAFANIVHNAIKFSKEHSTIQIRIYRHEDLAVTEVEDCCGGIDLAKVESMFSPYTQESTDRSGLGLGLSIARRAVQQAGGDIDVVNLPDKGCVFKVRLPLLTEAIQTELST